MGKEKKKIITMSLFNMYTHVYILNFYDRFHSSSHCLKIKFTNAWQRLHKMQKLKERLEKNRKYLFETKLQ